jgi:transposase
MDGMIIIVFALVLVLGCIFLAFISFNKGGKKYLDVEKYRVKWLAIEQQVKKDEEASYQMAIFNADKLLDQALKERGFAGNTMGERMKSAQKSWSNANNTWTAHKLRNQIAHETDVRINYDTTRRALAAFKQALKDVRAI